MNAVFTDAFAEALFLPSAVLSLLIMAATAGLILLRRRRPQQGDLLTVRETGMTGLLGFALWLEVFAILYSGLAMPERLFTSTNARFNAVIFLLVGAVAGSAALLYYFVKCVVVREHELLYVNPLGAGKALAWEQVEAVSVSMGKRLMLTGPQSTVLRVGGEPKSYQKFLRLASEKLPKAIDRAPLRGLLVYKKGEA